MLVKMYFFHSQGQHSFRMRSYQLYIRMIEIQYFAQRNVVHAYGFTNVKKNSLSKVCNKNTVNIPENCHLASKKNWSFSVNFVFGAVWVRILYDNLFRRPRLSVHLPDAVNPRYLISLLIKLRAFPRISPLVTVGY